MQPTLLARSIQGNKASSQLVATCLKPLPLHQIHSYFSETEFSAENQRAFHYEHSQRRVLRFACGFCKHQNKTKKSKYNTKHQDKQQNSTQKQNKHGNQNIKTTTQSEPYM
jgi:hypothetical protein